MKFKIRFADQIVGLFILIAIVGLAAVLILLGANQRWFAKNYVFSSRFISAKGLSVGMPIQLKGFAIGKVQRIALNPENMVDIEFYVFDTYYHKILPNSILELAYNPLGLGGGLIFHPGRPRGETVPQPLPEFSFIPSMDLEEGKRLVKENLVELPQGEDLINSVLSKVGPIMDELYQTLASINELTVSVNASLSGTGKGPVSSVLNDLATTSARLNELLENLTSISDNVEQMTAAFRDPTGMARKLLDPKGSVATLLDDDNQLFNQIVRALEQLNGIIKQLQEFSRFVNSTQPQLVGILEKGKVTLDKGNDVLEAVKNNPLLRGGVPPRQEQPTTFQGYRDTDF